MTDTTESGTTSESTIDTGSDLVEVGIESLSDDELQAVKEGKLETLDDDALVDGDEEYSEETETDESQKYVTREEHEKLLAQLKDKDGQLEKQLKHTKNLERFNNQRNNEIGSLRKELAQQIIQNRKILNEAALTADEDFRVRAELLNQEQAFDQLTEEQSSLNDQGRAIQAVAQHLGEDLPLDGMVELLRSDGISDDLLGEFAENPYALGEAAVINIAKRVQERQQSQSVIRKLYSVAEQAIAALKQAESGTGSKAKREVLRGINQAMKDTSYLNGASGGSRGQARINETDVTKMSDEELKAYLDSARQ